MHDDWKGCVYPLHASITRRQLIGRDDSSFVKVQQREFITGNAVTATFDGLGFEFLYPDGWELQKDETGDWPRTVSVHSPTGAFVSLTLYEREGAPMDLLDELLATLRDEYSDAEIHRTPSTVPGFEQVDAFQADYFCLDFLVTARACRFDVGAFVLLTMYQGENRDFDQLLPVFDAIAVRTLSNLAKS